MTIYQKMGKENDEAKTLNNIGTVLDDQGKQK
jgi:hypothetical protein